MRGGYYRPAAYHSLRGGARRGRQPRRVAAARSSASRSSSARPSRRMVKDGVDDTAVEGASDLPYAIPQPRASTGTRRPAACRRCGGDRSATRTRRSSSRASSTSWPTRPARIRSSSAAGCSAKHPRHQARAGARRREGGLGQAAAAGRGGASRCTSRSAATSRRSPRSRSRRTGKVRVHRVVARDRLRPDREPRHRSAPRWRAAIVFGLTAALYGEITSRTAA